MTRKCGEEGRKSCRWKPSRLAAWRCWLKLAIHALFSKANQSSNRFIHPIDSFIHSIIHSFIHSFNHSFIHSISLSLTHLYHQQTLQRQYKPHSFFSFSFFFFLFLLRLSSTQTQPTPERNHHRQRRNGSQNRVLRLSITPNNTHSTQNELARRR